MQLSFGSADVDIDATTSMPSYTQMTSAARLASEAADLDVRLEGVIHCCPLANFAFAVHMFYLYTYI